MTSQRKRQQRVRHEVGESKTECPAMSKEQSNKPNANIMKEKNNSNARNFNRRSFTDRKTEMTNGLKINQTNVSVAESQNYQTVTYMEDKPNHSVTDIYSKRPISENIPLMQMEIISNWHKFDSSHLDEEIDPGEDFLMGEDFSEILQLSKACGDQGGHLHLKGEVSWGEISGSEGLGDLGVSDLAAAFATIPFHKQLHIPENMLPAGTINYYVKLADDKKKSYKFNCSTTTSANDINQKIIESLTLKSDWCPGIKDESVHQNIALVKKHEVTANSNLVLNTSSENDKPVNPIELSFDFSRANITSSPPKIQTSYLNNLGNIKPRQSDESINNLYASSVKTKMEFTVPSSNNRQSDKKEQAIKPSCVVEPKIDPQLEDWLDSMLED